MYVDLYVCIVFLLLEIKPSPYACKSYALSLNCISSPQAFNIFNIHDSITDHLERSTNILLEWEIFL